MFFLAKDVNFYKGELYRVKKPFKMVSLNDFRDWEKETSFFTGKMKNTCEKNDVFLFLGVEKHNFVNYSKILINNQVFITYNENQLKKFVTYISK